MQCTRIIHSPTATHMHMCSSSCFLVILLHQGAESITFNVKEGTYQIMETNALFEMHYTCRKKERLCVRARRNKDRERKDILSFMKTYTFVSVLQESLHVPAGEIILTENFKAPVKAQKGNSFCS